MSKVFRQSAFLFLVVGFLVLVKADPLHHESDHSSKISIKQKDHHDDDDDYHSTKLTIRERIHIDRDRHHDDDDDRSTKVKQRTHLDSETGKTVVPVRERNENNCNCVDGKVKQFAQKFALILRTYGSKELRPELQRVATKFVNYVVSYLAQEKPEQMGKVNNFLQSTARLTSNAMAKSSSN